MSSDDTPLSPSQRSKIRRLAIYQEPAPGDEAGELNIVPYLDIIMNILVFVLATISVVYITNIDVTSAGDSGKTPSKPTNKALNLTVIIARDGIGLKTGRGGIAPGCDKGTPQFGEGNAIPALVPGQTYDYAALKICVDAVKAQNPDWADEHEATIVANAAIEYHTIIDVADAIRANEKGDPLFPDIHFGALR